MKPRVRGGQCRGAAQLQPGEEGGAGEECGAEEEGGLLFDEMENG